VQTVLRPVGSVEVRRPYDVSGRAEHGVGMAVPVFRTTNAPKCKLGSKGKRRAVALGAVRERDGAAMASTSWRFVRRKNASEIARIGRYRLPKISANTSPCTKSAFPSIASRYAAHNCRLASYAARLSPNVIGSSANQAYNAPLRANGLAGDGGKCRRVRRSVERAAPRSFPP
jgi:hypothetical protein